MIMKIIETKEELQIIHDVESGKCQFMEADELEKWREIAINAAKNTLRQKEKRKAINISIFEEDIAKLQTLALDRGLPYQTYITSILHQIANGKKLAN